MSSKTKIGSKKPIVIEFTYDEWKRIERLSNRDGGWIEKFYDAILSKAQLIPLHEIKDKCGKSLDNTQIVLGDRAYERFDRIFEKKVLERYRAMESLQYSPAQTIQNINENQILIYPQAFGLKRWESHAFR